MILNTFLFTCWPFLFPLGKGSKKPFSRSCTHAWDVGLILGPPRAGLGFEQWGFFPGEWYGLCWTVNGNVSTGKLEAAPRLLQAVLPSLSLSCVVEPSSTFTFNEWRQCLSRVCISHLNVHLLQASISLLGCELMKSRHSFSSGVTVVSPLPYHWW